MNSIRRVIPAAAAITGVALLAAGCGGGSPTTTTNSASGGAPKDIASAAYHYAACMRNHGVSNFPDPQVSTSGGDTKVAMVVPSSIGSSPKFDAAQTACKSILP